MFLHMVSASPFVTAGLGDAIRYSQPGDKILLLADGVYAATRNKLNETLISGSYGLSWYAIDEDCDIRGITSTMMLERIKRISYRDFVALTNASEKIISW